MARLNTRNTAQARENASAGPAHAAAANGGRANGRSARRRRRGEDNDDDDEEDDDDAEALDVEQSAEDRRKIQREIRSLIEKTNTEQTRFLDVRAPVLQTVLDESEVLLHRAKQTTEVAVDAALVLRISELAYKRTANFLSDRTTSAGIDLDDFVARCADYMHYGRGIADPRSPALSRAQRRKRRREAALARRGGNDAGAAAAADQENAASDLDDDDDDEEDDDDDADAAPAAGGGGGGGGFAGGRDHHQQAPLLDWAHFGEYACLPRVRRPGLARFLPPRAAAGAGEDAKARVVRRRAAALRLHELEEVRPQVLQASDLANGAGGAPRNDLTALAAEVLQQLRDGIKRGQAQVQRVLDAAEAAGGSVEGAALQRLLDQHGLRSDGGVDLVRFAVNPDSFAQTVENFFYISFLVRDGRVGLAYDDSGLPSIYPVADEDANQGKGDNNATEDTLKKQLIFTLDMPTWRDMIETYHIEQPMIPHRQTAAATAHPSGRAWFT